ncbi:MAG: DNA polymerase III subunit delta' [Candidatus Omnitrophica bacterium]|nr:DNA polymerase III subunit delta' [Candidatus Omnitrophota bacterium]
MPFEVSEAEERAVSSLKRAIESGKLAHAYIFAGVEGCGKSLLAVDFAKAVNCQDKENAPCGFCSSCRRIDSDSHPDVRWIRKADDSSEIKIGQIRELESQIILKPYEGRYKVFIIADAGLMNAEASNSFLKTLEEPPENSLILLIAKSPGDLLPTVVSRCQIIRLRPCEKYEDHELMGDVLDEFSDDNCVEEYSGENRGELSGKLSILASWYRDLLVYKATGDDSLLVNFARSDRIKEEAGSYSAKELEAMFQRVLSAKENVENNVNPKLALSAMFKEIG